MRILTRGSRKIFAKAPNRQILCKIFHPDLSGHDSTHAVLLSIASFLPNSAKPHMHGLHIPGSTQEPVPVWGVDKALTAINSPEFAFLSPPVSYPSVRVSSASVIKPCLLYNKTTTLSRQSASSSTQKQKSLASTRILTLNKNWMGFMTGSSSRQRRRSEP